MDNDLIRGGRLEMRKVVLENYRFSRPLTEPEAKTLAVLIGWRWGSSVAMTGNDVVGCRAHPDDLKDFVTEVKNSAGDPLTVTTESPAV